MITIYKIELGNKEFENPPPPIYFDSIEAAEATMNTFNALTAKGKTIEWKCEAINVLSKQDALDQFIEIGKTLPE